MEGASLDGTGQLVINLIIGGGGIIALGRLLQQQYEGRMTDFKERILDQSKKIETLLSTNATLAETNRVLVSDSQEHRQRVAGKETR